MGLKMKTLIVDDEVLSCKILEKIMLPLGETNVARDGPSAVNIFKQSWADGLPYDLIFLDVGLKQGSGVETLQQIRSIEQKKMIPRHKRTKIIMVTADSDKKTVMSCVKAGCDDYIVKPAIKNRIYDKLKQIGCSL